MPGFGPFSFAGDAPRQDFVMLGGQKSPGKCEIVGVSSPRTWNIRQGWGLSGADIGFVGTTLSKFDLVITLWEPSHWDDWADFADVLALPKAPPALLGAIGGATAQSLTTMQALDISHPLLVVPPLNITRVVVEDVLAPMQDEYGEWTIVIKCIEFRKPIAALAKVDRSIPATPSTALPDAKTVAQKKIAQLLEQQEALADQ